MRQGQNKRMRGRTSNNGNNRRGPNPLTRSYESNGPDVKIRGTAHHVAEKYLQLARDAQTSGDPVMAESYLQHAEHYFRLIAAAQLQQQQAQSGTPATADGEDEGEDDDDFGGLPDRFASPQERVVAPVAAVAQPQPERPAFSERPDNRQDSGRQDSSRQDSSRQDSGRQDNRGQRPDRNFYQDRNNQDRNNQDRGGQDRGGQDRNNQDRNNPNQQRYPRDAQQQRRQREFRYDQPRPDQPRQDLPRQDVNRQEQPRQEQPRQEQPRQEQPRHDNFRDDAPRAELTRLEGGREPVQAEPRFVPAPIEAAGLPAFITAPLRVAGDSAATQVVEAQETLGVRPRKRRRTRDEIDADNAASAKADLAE